MVDGKPRGAHVVAWELEHGPVPTGLHVCHRCDVKLCVRVQHLFLGTQAENLADMTAKGRRRAANQRGALNGMAKLDEAAVRLIRASAEPTDALAASLGVCPSSVRNVRRGKTWAHVVP